MIKNEKGFTLIEVLASIVILFIVLITFFSTFTQSAMFTRSNEQFLQTTNEANRIMEILREAKRAEENELRALLLYADLIYDSCQPSHLFGAGCQSINDSEILVRISLLEPEVELGLVPVRIEMLHSERETVVDTRHLYVSER